MGNSYTRQSSAEIVDGNLVEAGPINNEFNALQNSFDGILGHTHDGTVGEGALISLTAAISGVLPVANGGIGGINKLDATTAPSTSDDIVDGYAVGSLWVDVTAKVAYICLDNSLSAAVWRRYQPYSVPLTSIAGLTTTANQTVYTTGADAYATTALTPYARTILDDADASTALSTLGITAYAKTLLDDPDVSTAQSSLGISPYIKTMLDDNDALTARNTLGLGSVATLNAINGSTWSGTDLSVADGGTGASDATSARNNLGLGSMAIQNFNTVGITGGSITGITDLALADGGTGSSTAAGARTNLDVYSTTEAQAQNALRLPLTGGTLTGPLNVSSTASKLLVTYPSVAEWVIDVNSGGTFTISKTGVTGYRLALNSSGNLYWNNGTNYIGSDGNVVGSVWANWGYSDAYSAIYNRIESRAAAWANDRIANMQYRKVSLSYNGASGGFSNIAGAVIVGYQRVGGGDGEVSGLYYMYLQIYDPVRGWVGFSDQ
jgi:hypothetical protein